jgi:hypothetical protein
LGEALVDKFILGEDEVETLPSPEELKGRILVKTKNKGILNDRVRTEDDEVAVDLDESTSFDGLEIKKGQQILVINLPQIHVLTRYLSDSLYGNLQKRQISFF